MPKSAPRTTTPSSGKKHSSGKKAPPPPPQYIEESESPVSSDEESVVREEESPRSSNKSSKHHSPRKEKDRQKKKEKEKKRKRHHEFSDESERSADESPTQDTASAADPLRSEILQILKQLALYEKEHLNFKQEQTEINKGLLAYFQSRQKERTEKTTGDSSATGVDGSIKKRSRRSGDHHGDSGGTNTSRRRSKSSSSKKGANGSKNPDFIPNYDLELLTDEEMARFHDQIEDYILDFNEAHADEEGRLFNLNFKNGENLRWNIEKVIPQRVIPKYDEGEVGQYEGVVMFFYWRANQPYGSKGYKHKTLQKTQKGFASFCQVDQGKMCERCVSNWAHNITKNRYQFVDKDKIIPTRRCLMEEEFNVNLLVKGEPADGANAAPTDTLDYGEYNSAAEDEEEKVIPASAGEDPEDIPEDEVPAPPPKKRRSATDSTTKPTSDKRPTTTASKKPRKSAPSDPTVDEAGTDSATENPAPSVEKISEKELPKSSATTKQKKSSSDTTTTKASASEPKKRSKSAKTDPPTVEEPTTEPTGAATETPSETQEVSDLPVPSAGAAAQTSTPGGSGPPQHMEIPSELESQYLTSFLNRETPSKQKKSSSDSTAAAQQPNGGKASSKAPTGGRKSTPKEPSSDVVLFRMAVRQKKLIPPVGQQASRTPIILYRGIASDDSVKGVFFTGDRKFTEKTGDPFYDKFLEELKKIGQMPTYEVGVYEDMEHSVVSHDPPLTGYKLTQGHLEHFQKNGAFKQSADFKELFHVFEM